MTRIAIVVAQFNDLVTSRLVEGAKKALLKSGLSESDLFVSEVPGAYELPLAAQWCIDSQKVDGVVALGAVIRGTTSHYDYVCSATTSGLMNVQLSRSVPVGFGVLTCDTLEQAFDRVGGKLGNKGAEVALAVLEMTKLKKGLESVSRN